jgi:hypothetical protein
MFKDNLSFMYSTMESLRKEIEQEMKRTRLDKGRLYDLLLKIIDNNGSGGVGPQGPPGPTGAKGPTALPVPSVLPVPPVPLVNASASALPPRLLPPHLKLPPR